MTDIIDALNATDIIDANGASDVIDGNVLVTFGDPSAVSPSADTRTMHLESLDGEVIIALNVDTEHILLAGATGLGLPPLNVVTGTTPGMHGSWLQEVDVLEREVFLPLEFASEEDQAHLFAELKQLRTMVWNPDVQVGDLGTFLLVCNSSEGERVIAVTYKSGMEGTWGAGVDWDRESLTLVAVDPYFRDRVPTTLPFHSDPGTVYLGTGDNTHPWPRRISSTLIIGTDMTINVEGDVPVWPQVEIDGPVTTATMTGNGIYVNVPAGIPDSQVLTLVTDPRARSARLNGNIAWPYIDMGSTFAPLRPGPNLVSVVVGTDGANTGLTLSWTPGYLTPW